MGTVLYRSARPVFAYGAYAGQMVADDTGWHYTFDCDGSQIGHHSTEHRALHAIDAHRLLSIYGTTAEALLAELRRGLIALDQDPANENRLSRLNSDDIRRLSAELLASGWHKPDLARLIARWRVLRGENTP
jgi:hypothetical protein